MYQFSRSLYRELGSTVAASKGEDVCIARQRFLRSCEQSMERLALDRHYFAKPVKTLFNDIRSFFPISEQMRVFHTVERYVALATEYVESQARAGVTFDGSPQCCHASTRSGTPCQRIPLPGRKYCPSHKHLEDVVALAVA